MNKALIISHENFDYDFDGRLKRKGNARDVTELRKFVSKLEYEPDVKHDKTKEEVIEAIKTYASDFHKDSGCVMIFVMTHGGENGTLYAKDTHYNTKDLWEPFLNDDKFNGKLKLFVINACRGKLGEPKIEDNVRRNDVLSFGTNFPHRRDFLLAYSSMDKHVAYRNSTEGSIFIQEICKELQDIKGKTEILKFFTQVTRSCTFFQTSITEKEPDPFCQTPVIVSSNINSYIIEPCIIEGDSTGKYNLKRLPGVVTTDCSISFGHQYPSSVVTDGNMFGEPVELPTSYTMKNPKTLLFHAKDDESSDLRAIHDHFGKLNYVVEATKHTEQTMDQLQELSQDNIMEHYDGLVLLFHGTLKESNNSFEDNLLQIGSKYYPISDIISKFTANNCEFLKNKPKVFLFFEEKENWQIDSLENLILRDSPSTSFNQPINNNVDMLVFLGLEKKILKCFSTELSKERNGENVMNILRNAMHAAQDTKIDKVPHFQSTLRFDLFFGSNSTENLVSILKIEKKSLQMTNTGAKQKISNLEEQFSIFETDKINSEKKTFEIEKGLLKSNIDKLTDQVSEVKSEYKSLERKNTKLNEKIVTLNADKSKLEIEKSQIEEEKSKTISQLNEKLNVYMKKEKKQDEKIEEIQKENQKLLTERKDVENKNSGLMNEIRKLSAQIEYMKKKFEIAKPFLEKTKLKNEEIVEAYRKKLSLEDHKKTIMREACWRGDIEVVRALLDLDYGANDRVDSFSTGLHGAAFSNRANVVSLLLDHSADVNLRVANSDGWTPLMHAAALGSLDSAQVLLTRGADKTLRSTESPERTALGIARDWKQQDMIDYLVSVGVPE